MGNFAVEPPLQDRNVVDVTDVCVSVKKEPYVGAKETKETYPSHPEQDLLLHPELNLR